MSALALDPFRLALARAFIGIRAPLFFAVATSFVLNVFDEKLRWVQ